MYLIILLLLLVLLLLLRLVYTKEKILPFRIEKDYLELEKPEISTDNFKQTECKLCAHSC